MNRISMSYAGETRFYVATKQAYDREGHPIGHFVEWVEAYTAEELKEKFTPCPECGKYNKHDYYFVATGQTGGGSVEGYSKKCSKMEK